MAISSPTKNSVHFNWDHFLQVEARHRQIKDLLSGALVEAEAEQKGLGGSTITQFLAPIFQPKRGNIDDIKRVKESLRAIRRGLAETEFALQANHNELHKKLHEWLSVHDSEYVLSYELEHRYEEISRAVIPLKNCFHAMLKNYGATRNEIAVAYNKSTGEFSSSARTSVDRLMDSYESLLQEELNLSDRLAELNARVERSAFRDIMQPLFELAVAPDCRPGMAYSELQDHFEKGAAQVSTVLQRFTEYVNKIKSVDLDHHKIMHDYRVAEWEKHRLAREESMNAH